MSDLILRRFIESDWPQIVSFYEKFYRPGYIFTNRPFFNWNFDSPLKTEEPSTQHLLLDRDKIIGFMGALIWPFKMKREQIIGECNINLFVDSDYRGQRLGQRLLEGVSTGFRCSLSTSYNPKTFTMYKRQGEIRYWPMLRFVKSIDPNRIKSLMDESPRFLELDAAGKKKSLDLVQQSSQKLVLPEALSFNKVKRFDKEWDVAWNEISQGYDFTTWRSSAFLNWRYIDYPFPLYDCYIGTQSNQIHGLVVLRKEKSQYGPIVRIVDLVATKGLQKEVFAFADSIGREIGAIFTDYLAGGALDNAALSKTGYVELVNNEDKMILPMDFHPIRQRDSIPSLMMFQNPDDPAISYFEKKLFYIVKGDSDLDRAN